MLKAGDCVSGTGEGIGEGTGETDGDGIGECCVVNVGVSDCVVFATGGCASVSGVGDKGVIGCVVGDEGVSGCVVGDNGCAMGVEAEGTSEKIGGCDVVVGISDEVNDTVDSKIVADVEIAEILSPGEGDGEGLDVPPEGTTSAAPPPDSDVYRTEK